MKTLGSTWQVQKFSAAATVTKGGGALQKFSYELRSFKLGNKDYGVITDEDMDDASPLQLQEIKPKHTISICGI